MTDDSDACSTMSGLCFGRRGERIKFENKCCCSLCIQGNYPCPIIPICIPRSLCPCYPVRHLYVKDAQKRLYEIKKARSQSMDIYHREVQIRTMREDNTSMTSDFQ
jgi:hypothetical protein